MPSTTRGPAARALGATALLLACLSAPLAAQESTTGRLTGRILDETTGAGLADVGVQVVGTTIGATSGPDGRYTIASVPSGTVTIHVRRLGFQPKTVTGILLDAGRTVTQDVALAQATVQLAGVQVTAAAERGTVHEALDQQREAAGIVNAITAEQMSRSPDSDAAAAVQRVSGVTVQDGKYVFVRGLGERYTTTSLNGARIPSPEPEKKVVPLDLFPSSLLRTVTTSKTFTPDQPGDFSGAQVDIRTREFPAVRTLTWSTSVGVNDAATGRTVIAAPTASPGEWVAMANGHRDLPAPVRDAGSFLGQTPTRQEMNGMIGSFRNSWTPVERRGIPGSSFGVSLGGNDPILGRQLGYIGALTYSLGQEVRLDEYRAQIDGATGNTAGNEFLGETGRTSVLWGGLLNLSTFVGQGHLFSFNNMLNRSADNEARQDVGSDENIGRDVLFRRSTLRYVERSVRSNQISGAHRFGERHAIDWSVTSSAVARREPDRSDLVYARFPDLQTGAPGPWQLYSSADAGARRTFGDLSEGTWNLEASHRLALSRREGGSAVQFGALYRATDRDAEVLQYGITGFLPSEEAQRAAEEIFDGRHTSGDASVFNLVPLGQAGSYVARDRLLAGYAMVDLALGSRLRLVGGVRLEDSDVAVTSIGFFGDRFVAERPFRDYLPSAALTLRMTDDQNVRVSLSQTLARPEYRELSPIVHRDVLGEVAVQGNQELRRTLIRNADVRWEWYPNPGDILSIGLFGKRFIDPIERVETPTSGTLFHTFINAEGAVNYGVELEARAGLGGVAHALEPLSLFTNATVMHSEIRLGENELVSATNRNRPMVGQAPYVVNAGLTWASRAGGTSATALYNVVGRRIITAGGNPLPDIHELSRHSVDLSLRTPLPFAGVEAKLDVRNLLDAPYRAEQGPIVRERYRSGRGLSLGFTWRP